MVQKREDVPGREHIESGHSFSWQTFPCSGLREYGTVFTFFGSVNIATHYKSSMHYISELLQEPTRHSAAIGKVMTVYS